MPAGRNREFMISCSETSELANIYVDGGLPEELMTQIERHQLTCPSCAFEIRSLEQTRSLVSEAFSREESSPSFRERTAARLQSELSDLLAPPIPLSDAQWAL